MRKPAHCLVVAVARAAVVVAAAWASGAQAQSLVPLTGSLFTVSPVAPRTVTPAFRVPPAMVDGLVPRAGGSPGRQCRSAIRIAEQAANIPDQLMAAIGRVESGRREADGSVNPWPWSINAEGTDHVFETKAAAIAAVQALQRQGVRSIDVGCMQVNLLQHPTAFATLEDAFDPSANATYAARFLVRLHEQTGAWPTATAWYHSATPDIGADYQRKVMAVLPEERKQRQDTTRADLAVAWAATLPVAAAGPVVATGMAPMTRPVGAAGFAPMTHPAAARLIPMASGTAGRSLSVYRAIPIPLAARLIDRLPPAAGGINSRG
jgi:Transglycosylase SLT domain